MIIIITIHTVRQCAALFFCLCIAHIAAIQRDHLWAMNQETVLQLLVYWLSCIVNKNPYCRHLLPDTYLFALPPTFHMKHRIFYANSREYQFQSLLARYMNRREQEGAGGTTLKCVSFGEQKFNYSILIAIEWYACTRVSKHYALNISAYEGVGGKVVLIQSTMGQLC